MKRLAGRKHIGKVVDALTIVGVERRQISSQYRTMAICRCECGNLCEKHLYSLTKVGRLQSPISCGCKTRYRVKGPLDLVTENQNRISQRRGRVRCIIDEFDGTPSARHVQGIYGMKYGPSPSIATIYNDISRLLKTLTIPARTEKRGRKKENLSKGVDISQLRE